MFAFVTFSIFGFFLAKLKVHKGLIVFYENVNVFINAINPEITPWELTYLILQ